MSSNDVTIEPEDPELAVRNVVVGVRLWSSAVSFLFMAFVFAFFYLRALNTNNAFVEPHSTPPSTWGFVILGCVLASVAAFDIGRKQLRADGSGAGWLPWSFTALLLGLAAFAVQILEYFHLTFGANGGGLASVFFGFTFVYAVIWLGAVYWIETLWAQTLRNPPADEAGETAPALRLKPSADAAIVFLYTMAAIEVVAFALLYAVQ
jgi:heme/copper-type cytochrome/quinol oxidase subunit 3